MEVACGWSQRGISYFISSYGSISAHDGNYLPHCEDNYGNVAHNELNRRETCQFLCEFLRLIDDYCVQRQNVLALEKRKNRD